ncbi:MAG: tetratricopeptide repeat protein [Wenzhouxiangella sp.]|jgi:tetratricopeptide (TPR) repeat protein|nr:tetratricopeptide repeat protein [Wenzhouxiangella sp.]
MSSLGAVQANFGRAEAAATLFEAAWEKQADQEILVRWANARLELGELEQAAELFAQAHAGRESMSEAMQAFHAASYAQLKVIEGNVDQALDLAQTAAEVAPVGSVDEVFATDTLAQVLFHSGDWPRAVEAGRRALALGIDYYGDPHLQVATSRNNLALFLGRLGEDEEALDLLEQATRDFETLLGSDDPRLAVTYSNLGNRRSLQRRFEPAITAYDRALQLTALHYGNDHSWIGLILGYKGRNAQRMGELDTAADLFRQAMVTLGDSPNHRGRVRLAWASNEALVGDLEAALEMLDLARMDLESVHPEGHPQRLAIDELKAQIHLEQGEDEAAAVLISKLRQTSPDGSPALNLLEAQTAAKTHDCEQARRLWSDLDQSTEMEKPVLFRLAMQAIERTCS